MKTEKSMQVNSCSTGSDDPVSASTEEHNIFSDVSNEDCKKFKELLHLADKSLRLIMF